MNLKRVIFSLWLLLSVEVFASGYWQSEYSLFQSNTVATSEGKIIVIGNIHEDPDVRSEFSLPPENVIHARNGFVEFIDSTSRERDLVFYEGAYFQMNQIAPSRSIYDQLSDQKRRVQATFNKDLYILGWEDDITFAVSLIADRLRKQSYELGTSMPASLAKLRAQYFYLKVILIERNEKAVQLLKEAVRNSPLNRNIYFLVGGAHLFDPQFIKGIKSLGRPFEIYKNRHITTDEYKRFIELKDVLKAFGVDTRELDSVYQTTYDHLNRYRSLTVQDFEAIKTKIFGYSVRGDCRGPLKE